MTATTADRQRLQELRHKVRLLQGELQAARPAVSEADNHIDEAISMLEEAEANIAGALSMVLDALEDQDQIESGDRDADGEPIPYPRYP